MNPNAERSDVVVIDLGNGSSYVQRKSPKTATEDPLSNSEKVILRLYSENKKMRNLLESKLMGERIKRLSVGDGDDNLYIHKKTGNPYFLLSEAINATNVNDGQEMVVYCNLEGQVFTRDKKEFIEKFERE